MSVLVPSVTILPKQLPAIKSLSHLTSKEKAGDWMYRDWMAQN